MNEAYTKMMMQQHLSKEADTAFHEKLEQAAPQRKLPPVWKAAIAAVCVLLLIPMTVWAAESIFGVTKVTLCERPVFDSKPGIGLDITYENIENYALEDFPKHLQKLEEGEEILHTTLADAEEYLGLDLIENQVLAAEDTRQIAGFKETGKHFKTYCGVWDGQFLFADIQSVYNRNDVRFNVTATVTVEHPTMDEKQYHSTNITYFDDNNREVHTEQYVTKAGIPVLIVVAREGARYNYGADYGALLDCFACFAVNNVSYKVEPSAWSFNNDDREKYETPEEKVMTALLEVLEGFTLE